MLEIYIEFVDTEVVVFRPGTSEAAATKPSLEEALAFARAEWPDLGIRIIFSKNVRKLFAQVPPKCVHCC